MTPTFLTGIGDAFGVLDVHPFFSGTCSISQRKEALCSCGFCPPGFLDIKAIPDSGHSVREGRRLPLASESWFADIC